jgi:hypothetical protein
MGFELKLIVIGLLCIFMVSFIIILYEAKRAPIIPDDQPFLHDDYDPSKDKIVGFKEKYCAKCKFYDKVSCRLYTSNIGKIMDRNICICIEKGFFEPE